MTLGQVAITIMTLGQVAITIMTLQARLGKLEAMVGQDSSHVNDNMQLNMETELDKGKELYEKKVQSWLIVIVSQAFSAPIIQSHCGVSKALNDEAEVKALDDEAEVKALDDEAGVKALNGEAEVKALDDEAEVKALNDEAGVKALNGEEQESHPSVWREPEDPEHPETEGDGFGMMRRPVKMFPSAMCHEMNGDFLPAVDDGHTKMKNCHGGIEILKPDFRGVIDGKNNKTNVTLGEDLMGLAVDDVAPKTEYDEPYHDAEDDHHAVDDVAPETELKGVLHPAEWNGYYDMDNYGMEKDNLKKVEIWATLI